MMRVALSYEIDPSHIESGSVPRFFMPLWQELESKRKRYSTKNDYEPLKDYSRESRMAFMKVILTVLSIIALAAAACTLPEGADRSAWDLLDRERVACYVVVLIAVSTLVLVGWSKPVAECNGHRCFEAVNRLFSVLDIPPDEVIGRLSREEFRAHIEDALRNAAQNVDNARGFSKVRLRGTLDAMHAAAWEWRMCRENVTEYFPKKAKA